MLNIVMYDIIQINDMVIWALKDCNYVYSYGPIKKQMFQTPLFYHIFNEKSACHDCVWYDEYL